jgi:membrane protein DedA with SNARE-associated domain
MSDFVTNLLDWMEALPPLVAYLVILGIAYGENVLPPIPGDIVVVFGGYLVGVGKLSFVIVVLLSTLGGLLGFMTMYAIGYAVGDAVMDPDRLRWIPKHQMRKANDWLGRYGYGLVAANRFLSGLRSVISLAVGAAHMDPWKTAVFATISAAIWTFLIAYGGYSVGENWEIIAGYLRDYGRLVLSLIVVGACIQLVRLYLKRKGRGTRQNG